MKQKTKKIKATKYIQTEEEIEIIEYITFDGNSFYSEIEAQNYEDAMKRHEIPSFSHELFSLGNNWYKAETEEHLGILRRWLTRNSRFSKDSLDKIKLGEWINVYYYEDEDNDRGYISTWKEFLLEVDKLNKRLEELS